VSISTFDLFSIGIGPSSSHTVGPMRAAAMFVACLRADGLLKKTARIRCELFGSLGATGKGHGSPKAVVLGLMGEQPESVEVESALPRYLKVKEASRLMLGGEQDIAFDRKQDLILHFHKSLPKHSNGMVFKAFDANGVELEERTYYSIGGGFVLPEGVHEVSPDETSLAYPFSTAQEMLTLCESNKLAISDLMFENEKAWRSDAEVKQQLLGIWAVMQECVNNGLKNEGVLPGGLKVQRRAKELHDKLLASPEQSLSDPLAVLDWVTLYALAVNEENAAGGRVVTAPTNGAAGIIPAVLHYYTRFTHGANKEGVMRFLLTAAAIGILYKRNASISGAEVGCQGEVGSACSMAAGALAEVLGGTPKQVENAAEIAMEHNLGLTCDPIGGLVQVPCIERNAMASVKAIHAARIALKGDGSHYVSLDKVIKTMRLTGQDMQDKYKETARGGLAINVVEVPVNVVEC